MLTPRVCVPCMQSTLVPEHSSDELGARRKVAVPLLTGSLERVSHSRDVVFEIIDSGLPGGYYTAAIVWQTVSAMSRVFANERNMFASVLRLCSVEFDTSVQDRFNTVRSSSCALHGCN